ncbi:MAG: flagellar filament capping protein FliD [Acidobacteria bacterium]|nr:flagellar filament capping protein FliD [Acidobacteriota bacterium]
MATTSASLSTTSLSGLGLTGLSSGLDTSGIITKLMAIESTPQTQLKNQLTTLQTHTTALQSLNSAVAALATTATAALGTNVLNSFSASTTSSAASATASSSSSPGSVSFTVGQLAASQVSVTGAMTTWPDTSSTTPSITIQTGTGSTATTKTITAASASLDDMVSAINSSGAGVSASKVAAGTDSTGAPQYRLQLTGTSGTANAFTVYEGANTAGTALPVTQITAAQDAQVTLYAGTAAQQTVTSGSNTFSGLLSGVDVTVSATSTTPVTVNVAANATAATTSAQALTSALISVFSSIAASSAITTTSSTSGGTSSSATSGSVFTGDPLVRNVNSALLSAATDPVNGQSPSTIGIDLTKDGTITFDQSAFAAAMASDPVGTTAMYQTIAGRVSGAAGSASDPYSGTISQQVTSETTQQSSLSTAISDWTTRLATIQAQYTAQFNTMETALNNLSSQSNYITSQISGLTTTY